MSKTFRALGELFVQVLKLCRSAGLVKLGHVALDGPKIQANASKHKAMSYRRMREAEAKLAAEVAAWFARAAAADAAEDRAHGPDRRGDEMPAWVVNKQARLERMRAAKATLEAEAKAPPPEDGAEPGPSMGMMNSGRPQRAPDGGPPGTTQLHRSRQPPPTGQGQLHPGLQRASRGRRRAADHRRSAPDRPSGRLPHAGAPGRRDPAQPRLQPAGTFRRCRLLQRGQSQGAGATAHRRLHRHRPRPTPPGAGTRGAHRHARVARGRDADQAQAGRATKSLPPAKADRRTSIRSDQGGQGLQTVPPARLRQGQTRMGNALHRPQPPQARKRNDLNRPTAPVPKPSFQNRPRKPLQAQAPRAISAPWGDEVARSCISAWWWQPATWRLASAAPPL